MSETPSFDKRKAERAASVSQKPMSPESLHDFKHVTNGLIQDAINLWDELWAELDGTNESASMIMIEAGFEPSCGWTEYFQKMWTLRHTLNFAKKYSRQSSETS